MGERAEPTDGALLAGCVDDPALFGDFYRRHVRAVLEWFVRRTACPQTAADLTAETFAAAFVRRSAYVEQGVPVGWLFGIAKRQLGTYQRRERVADRYRRRLGVGAEGAVDVAFERAEVLADLAVERAGLVATVDRLPRGQADAVRLRVVDDLPYEEVAVRLGVTVGAARVRVSRGLTRLAELVEADR